MKSKQNVISTNPERTKRVEWGTEKSLAANRKVGVGINLLNKSSAVLDSKDPSTRRVKRGFAQDNIQTHRKEIDRIDEQIIALLVKRLGVVGEIGKTKADNKEQITDNRREQEILKNIKTRVPEKLFSSIKTIYQSIISVSKNIQL